MGRIGPLDYADTLQQFQELFENLGRKYFHEVADKSSEYLQITARGDEGLIFYVSQQIHKADLIYKALEFVFELKGRLRTLAAPNESSDRPAKTIELGAGIHFGPIASLTAIEEDANGSKRSLIKGLEGYSINYAKRVESCSRQGSYSRVFLSKEATTNISTN